MSAKLVAVLSNEEHEAIAGAMTMGVRLNVTMAGGNPVDGRHVAHKILMAAVASIGVIEGADTREALEDAVQDLRRDFPAVWQAMLGMLAEEAVVRENPANISREPGHA